MLRGKNGELYMPTRFVDEKSLDTVWLVMNENGTFKTGPDGKVVQLDSEQVADRAAVRPPTTTLTDPTR